VLVPIQWSCYFVKLTLECCYIVALECSRIEQIAIVLRYVI
jgi:hypothetical protein